MINLHPKDAKIQHDWLEKHNKADLVSLGAKPNDLPAIAVYVNPIWRDKVNTANLMQTINNAIQYYENET